MVASEIRVKKTNKRGGKKKALGGKSKSPEEERECRKKKLK